jgi:hypothetical protein
MPPREASPQQPRGVRAAAGQRPSAGAQDGRRPLSLVTAVQDTQRKRRARKSLRRLAAIVPVSDYRDVVG